jgi:hypothetical protein
MNYIGNDGETVIAVAMLVNNSIAYLKYVDLAFSNSVCLCLSCRSLSDIVIVVWI